MRQVPRYLLVGDGCIARHFKYYLSELNIPFLQWSRKSTIPFSEQRLAPVILLLISDSAIPGFIEKNAAILKNPNQIIVHFSGQLSDNDFDPDQTNIYSAHPLMSFTPDNLYPLALYKKITFILENSAPDFTQLFPELQNPFFKIPSELKSYYHAWCVLSGNFTCILWEKFFSTLEKKLDVPKEAGFLYLNQITQNILNNPNTALTGPFARKDHKTIQANLAALNSEQDNFELIYAAFKDAHENT